MSNKSLLLILLNSNFIFCSPLRVNNSILDVGAAVETLADLLEPDVLSASQANILNAEIIPNLSRLIKEFTANQGSELRIGAGFLEAGMVQVVENVLVNGEQLCSLDNPSVNSSLISGVADELASLTSSSTQTCFLVDTRVTGTDIRGSVIRKVVRTSDVECQRSCKDEPQCKFFLFFNDNHYQTWKRGECRLLRQQGENQENESGHTSGPKTCPDTKQDTRDNLETLIQQTAEDTLEVECSRLASFESWRAAFVEQMQMNIEMSRFEGNQEDDVTKLEEDINAAILSANEQSPGAEISPAQTKQLLDTFVFQFYYLLSQSELNKSLFDPNYAEGSGDYYYDDDYDDEDDTETETEMNMDTFSLEDITNSDQDEYLVPDLSLDLEDEVIPEPEVEPEAEPEAEPAPEADYDLSKSSSDMDADVPNFSVDIDFVETSSKLDPYPEVEPQYEPYPEVELEYDPYPEFSIDIVAEPTVEVEPEYEPYPEVEPEYDPYPEFSIDVAAEPTAEVEPLSMGEPDNQPYPDRSHVDPPMDPCLLHSHSTDTTMAPDMGDEYGAKTDDDMMFNNDPIEAIMDPSLELENFIGDSSAGDMGGAWPVSYEDLNSVNPSDLWTDLEVVSAELDDSMEDSIEDTMEDNMEDTTTEDTWWSSWFTSTSSSDSVEETSDTDDDGASITTSIPVPKYVLSSSTQSTLSSQSSSTTKRISTTTTVTTTSTITTTTSTIQSSTTVKSSGFGSFWQQFYG